MGDKRSERGVTIRNKACIWFANANGDRERLSVLVHMHVHGFMVGRLLFFFRRHIERHDG